MNQTFIREAEEKDLPSILGLYSGIENDKRSILDIDSAKRQLKIIKSYPNYSIYVAEKDGIIIGTFELLIMHNLAHSGKPSAIVEDIVVDEEHRSKGLGREMMNYAMEISKKFGCYKLMLSSNINRERAHKFYDNLGFERHGYSFLVKF
jgi:GNAT superfamily N-acetyltransferase